MNILANYFSAKSIALIGASADERKLSHGVLRNMLRYGYKGKVYPVNPKNAEILGLACYRDILDVPEVVDLAVIVLQAGLVPEVLDRCGRKGVKTVTIISGGFREVGPEGALLEEKVLEILHKWGMRMIGPNCVGTVALYSGQNTTFIQGLPRLGRVGFVSQSGAVCGGVIDYALAGNDIGFSCFLSLGNEADITETDMIEYLGEDEHTSVISAYVEQIKDGRRFIDVARRVSRKKPIVILKGGRSEAGARAVSSHTGSLAGSQAAYQSAFHQSGVLVAKTFQELLDVSAALAVQPLPEGRRVAILTNAGGPAALASDGLAENDLHLADLEEETRLTLRKNLNSGAQVANPVDVLGGGGTKEFDFALKVLLADKNVDAVVVILVPHALINTSEIASAVGKGAQSSRKPILACMFGGANVAEAKKILDQYQIPVYFSPETLGYVLGSMYRYGQRRKEITQLQTKPAAMNIAKVQELLQGAPTQRYLGESETRPFLEAYGIPLVAGGAAHSAEDAVQVAEKIGYPVVLKIISQDIVHKSDAGGVRLSLSDRNAVRQAYSEIIDQVRQASPDVRIDGVLVEKMATKGREVIIGMRRDAAFGPLMMFGMGGTFVELMGDVSFRVAPLDKKDALEMIKQTKAGKLLSGIRGERASDIEAIVDCLLRLSQLACDVPQIQEIEINPLIVLPLGTQGNGAFAIDARMLIM